jgi:hypothetical protein
VSIRYSKPGTKMRSLAIAAAWIVATYGNVCPASEHESQAQAVSNEVANSASAVRGVELGEFQIRSYYPVEAQKSTVRFRLYAAAPADRLADIDELVENNRHKLRDQVITATRLAPLSAFDEPDLTSFCRRILARLRRALPELEIDNVYVSDFKLAIKSL